MLDLSLIGAPAFLAARRQDGIFAYSEANEALERDIGVKREALLGFSSIEAFGPEVGAKIGEFQQRCAETRMQCEYISPLPLGPGSVFCKTTLTPVASSGGQVDVLLGIVNDVTAHKKLEDELQTANLRLKLALEALGGAHWYFDTAQRTFELSPAFDTLLGIAVPRVMSVDEWSEHVVEDDRNDTCFADLLSGRIREGTAEFRILAGNGETRWLRCRRRSIASETEVTGIAGIVVDVTREKRKEAELSRQATSDELTGLANRRRFDRELAGAEVRGNLAILMIDVDQFKAYNDWYGHLAGDAALKTVAMIIGRIASDEGGLAARYGGEEFAVILPNQDYASATMVAERMLRALDARCLLHAGAPTGKLSVSIGVAAGRALDRPGAADLMTNADRALYRAKAACRGGWRGVKERPTPHLLDRVAPAPVVMTVRPQGETGGSEQVRSA